MDAPRRWPESLQSFTGLRGGLCFGYEGLSTKIAALDVAFEVP